MYNPTKKLETIKENIGKEVLLDDWIIQMIIADDSGEPMSVFIKHHPVFWGELYCEYPKKKTYLESYKLIYLDNGK